MLIIIHQVNSEKAFFDVLKTRCLKLQNIRDIFVAYAFALFQSETGNEVH